MMFRTFCYVIIISAGFWKADASVPGDVSALSAFPKCRYALDKDKCVYNTTVPSCSDGKYVHESVNVNLT